ncbi:ARPP-2 domain-containing protein [Streptomyces sp. NPDC088553]|uniref:ARPP-2 domain-containing protein n=1 Tax=Streptomyces sp. NPDC088553 TaxID=3365864 RepID=UPI00382B4C16
MTRIDLTGLDVRPAQVWGGVRLVPLVRSEPVPGLRLHREVYGGLGAVDLTDRTTYTSYVPHGFVADWTGAEPAPGAGRESAAYGTRLGGGGGGERGGGGHDGATDRMPVRRIHRMAKRRRDKEGRAGSRLRFLPLHLALEGYLALHFGGPSIVWDEWSREAVRHGLSPRAEAAYAGWSVPGLTEALRIFEVHPGQCGLLLYVADALAAAFVVPHPDDYRLLHPTLVEDLYGELVHQYAYYGGPVPEFTARIRDGAGGIRTLADLRAAAREQERAWAAAHDGIMARDLLETSYAFERVHRAGPFDLHRFLPPFERGGREQHIGELITDRKGRTAYLKTFRLSENQIRKGYLLRRLADCDWHLGRTAEALGTSYTEVVRRIGSAGLDTLLNAHVVAQRLREDRES